MKAARFGFVATVVALTLGSAACAQAEEEGKPEAAAAVVQDAPKTAEKAAVQSGSTPPPLSAYVGKYPFDKVQGVSFFEHPLVREAIQTSGIDSDVQRFIFADDNVVGPIRTSLGRLMLHGYDPAGAGVENWAILLTPDGRTAAVCYSSGVEHDVRGADWYYEGEIAFTLYQACPSREGDIESLSNWPIGPIPG